MVRRGVVRNQSLCSSVSCSSIVILFKLSVLPLESVLGVTNFEAWAPSQSGRERQREGRKDATTSRRASFSSCPLSTPYSQLLAGATVHSHRTTLVLELQSNASSANVQHPPHRPASREHNSCVASLLWPLYARQHAKVDTSELLKLQGERTVGGSCQVRTCGGGDLQTDSTCLWRSADGLSPSPGRQQGSTASMDQDLPPGKRVKRGTPLPLLPPSSR